MSTLLLCMAFALGQAESGEDEPTFGTPVSMSTEEMGAALAGPAAALGSGNVQQAGDQLFAILGDPAKEPIHGAAWAMLAGLYEKQDLLVPAILAWAKAIELDPKGNANHVLHAAELVDQVGDAGELAPVLGNNLGVAVDGAARNRLAEIAGTYHLRQGNFGPALGALMMGDKAAPGFADVELLRGVVLAQQERYTDAIAPLTTAQGLARSEKRAPRFDEAITLNVARAHYGNEDWGQAILWYSKVPRSSEFWLDAQFERAWAHFRAEDMNGALGLLMNHDAPFFEDFYWPETDLLRAYSLFMICKFPDASEEMNDFVAKYSDMGAELKRLGGTMSTEQAFEEVQAFRNGKPTQIPTYLLRPFRDEERMAQAETLIARIEQELGTAGSVPGAAGSEATKMLQARRQARVAEEGQRVLDKVDAAVVQLDDMLQGIEITKLDLLSLEQQMYERAAATGVLESGNSRSALRALRRDKKKSRIWPWQGEYWADELGWYQVTTPPDCPASLQTGDK